MSEINTCPACTGQGGLCTCAGWCGVTGCDAEPMSDDEEYGPEELMEEDDDNEEL